MSRQDDAFDVYFVPSVDEYNKYINNQEFQYYQGNGCSGTNWVSYNGFCQGVAQGSGLLIATHSHILINHLVTITAKLTEQSTLQSPNIPVVSEQSGGGYSPPQQAENPSTPNSSTPPNNAPNFSWIIGAIIIVGFLGGGLAAMRYALKR